MDSLETALAGRYRIDREIGAGGMAIVYLAEDLKHDRQVAVKVLRPELAAALGKERFLREIKIAAGLHHPHILPVFDSGESEGFLYYVMPYEKGQSLRDKLEKERELPIVDAVRILRDLLDALAYAHKHDVIHRDIKPGNILLSDRHALITDFGVARAVSEATGKEKLTTAGMALGTPTYMAPEQAAADPHVDHRADIYAAGAVGYELLTGRPPFLGTTAQMVLTAHIADDPEPISKYRESVPPALEALIGRCLEKRPADRWQSAEEILPHLEALATPSGGVRPVGSPQQARKSPWVKVATLGTLLAVVLAVIVLIQNYSSGTGTDRTPNRILVVPFENRTGDASLDPIGIMAADWLNEGLIALAPDVQAVPMTEVLQLLGSQAGNSGPESGTVAGLSKAMRAGTVISGSYYLAGGNLEFQAQVVDAIEGSVLGATEGIRGSVADPGTAIGLLRQQVSSMVAVRFDPLMRIEIPVFVQPPNYEAYHAYSLGLTAFLEGSWAESLEHLQKASTLDTTYTRARLLSVAVLSTMGQLEAAESLAAEVSGAPGGLSQYDRLRVELLLAGFRGDELAVYRAAREAATLVPGGTANFAVISAAVRVNRPREALEFDERLRSILPDGGERLPLFHFEAVAAAHHMLGEHEQEFEVARRSREVWAGLLPTIAFEIRALAGMGDVEAVKERVEECLSRRPERGWTPGDVIRMAASELVLHGQPDMATEVLRQAYEWHESRPSVEAESEAGRFELAQTLYQDGRLDEANGLIGELAEEVPENLDYLGYLGTIAARQGDREAADQISGRLRDFDQPYLRGQHTLWRARIASLLGERESALGLLREAIAQGRTYGPWLTADLDFQPLWDFLPYQDLMRPKG